MRKKGLSGIIVLFLALFLHGCVKAEPEEEKTVPEAASPQVFYSVEFKVNGVGGVIFGDMNQKAEKGADGKPVSVLEKDGFTFAGWRISSPASPIVSSEPVFRAEDVRQDQVVYADFRQVCDDIPLISIETENAVSVSSKETYVRCSVAVSDPQNAENTFVSEAKIRGRGNASWSFVKKGYKIKFSKRVNLLSTGEAKEKDWTLISCYGDQSMLRNYAACRMGELLDGIEWSPSCSFAEVWLNGNYLGVYMVSDQVEENPTRVAVDESLRDEIDRDYLFELDMYAGGEYLVDNFACGGKPYTIHSDVTAEQGRFLRDYMIEADAAVQTGRREEVERYVDLSSLVDMFLLQEYSKNIDVGWSSIYLLKKAGGKIYFTAPWDFDLSFGNDYRLDDGSSAGIYAGQGRDGFGQNNFWFIRLWKEKWFRDLLAERWNSIGDILDQLSAEVKELGEKLEPSMKRNYKQWNMLSSRTHMQPNAVLACKTYAAHVQYLLDWMDARRDFLNQVLHN